MSHLAVHLVSLLAFALLALAMNRHQQDLLGHALPASQSRLLRAGGGLALLASLTIAVAAKGWSFGLVSWCGHLSVSAGLVVLATIVWSRRKAIKQ